MAKASIICFVEDNQDHFLGAITIKVGSVSYRVMYINSLVLSDAANNVAGNTTYAWTPPPGYPLFYTYPGLKFTITGFTNPANNGTGLTCVSSNFTHITFNNPTGVAETHAGTATSGEFYAANQISTGASLAVFAQNINDAVNAGPGIGTEYSAGTVANPDIAAINLVARSLHPYMTLQALVDGVSGNSLVVGTFFDGVAWTSGLDGLEPVYFGFRSAPTVVKGPGFINKSTNPSGFPVTIVPLNFDPDPLPPPAILNSFSYNGGAAGINITTQLVSGGASPQIISLAEEFSGVTVPLITLFPAPNFASHGYYEANVQGTVVNDNTAFLGGQGEYYLEVDSIGLPSQTPGAMNQPLAFANRTGNFGPVLEFGRFQFPIAGPVQPTDIAFFPSVQLAPITPAAPGPIATLALAISVPVASFLFSGGTLVGGSGVGTATVNVLRCSGLSNNATFNIT